MSAQLRRTRRGERGVTLIELLVTLSIFGIIALSIGAATDIGVRALGNGGAVDRLAGTHDLSSLEQWLGGDVAHATCVSKSPADAHYTDQVNSIGACTKVVGGTPAACGSATASFICISWPAWGASPPVCHTAVYAQGASQGVITRTEYIGSSAQTALHLTTTSATDKPAVTVTWPPATVTTPSNPSRTWVKSLTVTFAANQIASNQAPPGGTLVLHPIATDPTAASVSGGPC